jgi:preprotein translocase subunit SecE
MKISILVNYFKGVWSELKKVSWPTRKEVINHTIIVLVSAAIAIALTSVVDFGLSKLIEYLVQNRG